MTDSVRIVAYPHPLREERLLVDVPVGRSVADLLPLAGMAPETTGSVYVAGERVPREEWATTRPEIGQLVVARAAVPAGAATNKDGPFRAILAVITVGLSEFPWRFLYKRIGFPLNPMFWVPETPTFDGIDGPGRRVRPFITGARNEMRPYSPVPVILAYRLRYRPPFAARPYSSWRGNKQHFHCLMTFGHGPLRLENHKFGDTPIASLGLKQLPANTLPEASKESNFQVREGWAGDPAIAYYLDQVNEEALQVDLRHDNSDGTRRDWSYRRTEVDVERIGVEVSFPEGLIKFDSAGDPKKLDVDIEVEFAPAGTAPNATTWEKAKGRDDAGALNKWNGIKVDDKRRAAFSVGIDWTVAKGQYDVRLRRKTPDRNKFTELDSTWWSTLRGYRLGSPISLTGLCTVAFDIQATGVLSGELDTYNAEASFMGTYYDQGSSSWVTPTASSTPTLAKSGQPAAHYRAVLTGVANRAALSTSRLDLATLATWAVKTESAGLHFSGVFDTTGTVFERLQAIAAMGRARPNVRDALFTVAYDLEGGATHVDQFSPRTYKRLPSELVFPEVVHGLRVQYRSRDKEEALAEIRVYDDGYSASNATIFETLQLIYCADKDEAWKHGRRNLAERRLRRERHRIEVGVENLRLNMIDPVLVAFEDIDATTGWGRVKTVVLDGSGNALGVTLDEAVQVTAGVDHQFAFRKSNGVPVTRQIVTPAATEWITAATFATPIPAASDQPVAGDHFLFNRISVSWRRCLVTSIEHREDLSAVVALVDEALGVYSADTSTASTATQSNTNSPVNSGSSNTGQLSVSASSAPGTGGGSTAGIVFNVTQQQNGSSTAGVAP